jgi:hypothetical protein
MATSSNYQVSGQPQALALRLLSLLDCIELNGAINTLLKYGSTLSVPLPEKPVPKALRLTQPIVPASLTLICR